MKPLRRRIAKDFHEKLLLLLAGILLYLLIDCWSQVWALTSWVLNILTPFFVGIGLAYLLDIPVERVLEFEDGLLEFIDTKYPEIYSAIRDTKEINAETDALIQKAIAEFKAQF